MKTEKVYHFKKCSLASEYFIVILNVALTLLCITMAIINSSVVVLGLLIVPLFFIYFEYLTVKLKTQYNQSDSGKIVTINPDRSMLKIERNGTTTTIENSAIKRVEVYSYKWYSHLIPHYEYVIIYTLNDERILLTNFTIPLLIYDKTFGKFLRKKSRTYFKRTFNYINEDLLADNSI